jgi:hypothetical protein
MCPWWLQGVGYTPNGLVFFYLREKSIQLWKCRNESHEDSDQDESRKEVDQIKNDRDSRKRADTAFEDCNTKALEVSGGVMRCAERDTGLGTVQEPQRYRVGDLFVVFHFSPF